MDGMRISPSLAALLSQPARDGTAFRVADARAWGVSKRQLSASRLHMPTPGIRSAGPLKPVPARAAAFRMALPDDVVFSHLTAAHLWGLALPWHLDRLDGPLELMRASGRARIERRGCASHRGLERRRLAQVGGLPGTSVADTWCDIIEKYRARLSLADAVVMGDAAVEMLCRTGPRVDPDGRVVFDKEEIHPQAEPGSRQWWSDPSTTGIWELCLRVADRGPFRGVTLAKAALALIRPRVWSPMETRSRLIMVDGGIREPRLNATVRDAAGVTITLGDLVWDWEQVVGAYNGPTHDEHPSRERDNAQRQRLEDEGWWLIEIYKSNVNTAGRRSELVRRVSTALQRPRPA